MSKGETMKDGELAKAIRELTEKLNTAICIYVVFWAIGLTVVLLAKLW